MPFPLLIWLVFQTQFNLPPEAVAAEGNVIKNEFVSGHGVWMKSLGVLAAK